MLRAQLVARLKIRLVRSVTSDTLVAGHDAYDAARVIEQIRSSETRQHVDSELLRLGGEVHLDHRFFSNLILGSIGWSVLRFPAFALE